MVTILEDVGYSALSRNGTMVTELVRGDQHEAVWMSRDGAHTSVDPSWRFSLDENTNYGWALSPDGTHLAVGLSGGRHTDIWIKELDAGPQSRLTFGGAYFVRPRWMSDGRDVIYVKVAGAVAEQGVYRMRSDGTGSPEFFFQTQVCAEVAVADNQEWIVLRVMPQGGSRDIVGFRPGIDSVTVPFLNEEYDEMSPELSGDGRWLAYTSTESGRPEIYVRPFPQVESGKWLVSTGGGFAPLWAHSERELFYLTPAREMVAATIRTSPTFEVTERRVLFVLAEDFVVDPHHTAYDISRDDQRFVMVRKIGGDVRQLRVIENIFEVLKQRVGNGND
jgi:serine/threonine-protein kinase